MRTSSVKAKGRRLQSQLAEALAAYFGLTIEAVPPTKPGIRKLRAGGTARYVPEGERADLRVRRMGEAGADVALLTKRARQRVALGGRWVFWEAKNVEAFALNSTYWTDGSCVVLRTAMEQHVEHTGYVTVAVLGKNRHPPVAAVRWDCLPSGTTSGLMARGRPVAFSTECDGCLLMPLPALLELLDGSKL